MVYNSVLILLLMQDFCVLCTWCRWKFCWDEYWSW